MLNVKSNFENIVVTEEFHDEKAGVGRGVLRDCGGAVLLLWGQWEARKAKK